MIHRKDIAAALCGITLVVGGALALQAADAPTPKGYVVGDIEVKDMDTYRTYAAQTPAIIKKYGGTYHVRGGQVVPLEGTPPASRVVVIEFPSVAAARAFVDSPEYGAIRPIRQKAAVSRLFIVEGVAP